MQKMKVKLLKICHIKNPQRPVVFKGDNGAPRYTAQDCKRIYTEHVF